MTRPVVGLDLSLASTGIAVHGSGIPTWCATIESTGKAGDDWSSRHRRLNDIVRRIIPAIPEDALIVLEAPAYSRNTGSAHDRAGLWWIAYDLILCSGRHVILPVPPNSRAKYATGIGNAGKDRVLAAAIRRYPDIDITGNDEADAVVLMAVGCRLLGEPIDDPMPVAHLAALDKLTIPEGALI